MNFNSRDEKLLREWIQMSLNLLEVDRGNAKGNVASAPSGTSAKSSSSSTLKQPTNSVNNSVDKGEEAGNEGNKDSKSSSVSSVFKNAPKSLVTANQKKAAEKVEKNKEIKSSIQKLNSPKDIAAFLDDVVRVAADDAPDKQVVKDAVKMFNNKTQDALKKM
jgi:hypothetical protein